MSNTVLSRERGVILHCDAEGCTASYPVAIIRVRSTRFAAARDGWSRGVHRGGDARICARRTPARVRSGSSTADAPSAAPEASS